MNASIASGADQSAAQQSDCALTIENPPTPHPSPTAETPQIPTTPYEQTSVGKQACPPVGEQPVGENLSSSIAADNRITPSRPLSASRGGLLFGHRFGDFPLPPPPDESPREKESTESTAPSEPRTCAQMLYDMWYCNCGPQSAVAGASTSRPFPESGSFERPKFFHTIGSEGSWVRDKLGYGYVPKQSRRTRLPYAQLVKDEDRALVEERVEMEGSGKQGEGDEEEATVPPPSPSFVPESVQLSLETEIVPKTDELL